ncbi:MAG: SDR family NAD(P)-dependent oxidoreductase, partial [Acidimicrobiaceae bacterium]|nr:SDR family NAD(P)-dependent oxidoreductase [Acidimicrobiaceae bacterium]
MKLAAAPAPRALVTGGSSGIGAAIVAALTAQGASVACTGRSRAALDRIAALTGAWTCVADL